MPSLDSSLTLIATTPPRTLAGRLFAKAPGRFAYALLGLATLASGFAPRDRYTWVLEVLVLACVYASVALVHFRWPTLRPSALSLWLLFAYGFVMLLGAHATYAHALPGEWLRAGLGLERNPWDRVGHLFQGAVPALCAYELVSRAGWSRALRLGTALAVGLVVSVLFEGLEVIAAHFASDAAAFVQTQGDPFDSLFDVLFAGLGALAVLAMRSRYPSTPSSATGVVTERCTTNGS